MADKDSSFHVQQARPVTRLIELDGIRGWAALSVAIFHLGWETFGQIVPAFGSPLIAVFNGHVAVAIFFILSGEALSSAYLATGNLRVIAGLAVRRPFRLSIPVFCSVMLVWLLQHLGWTWQIEAYSLVRKPSILWLASERIEPISVYEASKYSFLSMYNGDAGGRYNPFTWTMPVEMSGSVLVFAICPVVRVLKAPSTFLAIAAVACWLAGTQTGYMGCFLLGVLFALARLSGFFERLSGKLIFACAAVCGLVGSVFAASYGLFHESGRMTIGIGTLLAVSIYCSRPAMSFFRSRISQMLGTISFALYLVQFPVMISFTSWAIIYSAHHGGINSQSAGVIFFSSLLINIAVAACFEPIEMFTRWTGRRVAKMLLAA
jgi:peptidoglycan/LPS O-acetylase OafA/YrhL